MASTAVATVVQMMESLPEQLQDQVADRVREFAEIEDERKWDEAFANTQDKLAEWGRRVKADIAAGKAGPMDFTGR